MKRIRYLGGSWVDKEENAYPHLTLTVGNVYRVLQEDRHYFIKDDNGVEIFVETDPTIFEVVID